LERWYPFDGNANNASSSSFNGVTTNAALTTDRFGSANSAYLFGNNGYIQTPTLGQISSTSLTMSCWVNPSSTQNGGWNGVVSNQQSNSSGFLFQVSSGNYPWVTVSNGSGYNNVSNGSPLGSGWIHIVQVIKPGLMELYIDGIKTDSTTFTTSVIHNTSALYIGARRFGTSTYEYYSGSIDDVGIWSRALTAQEIQDLYLGCVDTIQQQPQSNTFGTVPGDAYFAVTHSDTAATFQWQQNSGTGWSNLSNLGIYSGTTTDSVVLTGITASLNNYGFRCLVNSCNMDTTDLATLTVVVTCQDSIQQQPQSNTFYTVPGDAYFAVTHSDAAATFQWQQNTGTGWSNLSNLGIYSGTTTDSVVLTGITAALNNYGFRCLVNSCNMDTTDLATLTVIDNIGVNEVVKDIIVSPNPTYGLLNIVLTSSAEYEVFNINGQRVAQGKTEGQIDITNLPTGSYQLIINNDDGRSTHTIQKI